MNSMARPVLTLASIALTLAGCAHAQTTGGGDPLGDMNNTELLTEGTLLKLRDANVRLVSLLEKNPSFAKVVPSLPGGNEKLDAAAGQIEQSPEVLAAIKDSGLSPKGYLRGMFSFTQAMTALQMARRTTASLTPGMVPQNVELIASHPNETRDLARITGHLITLQEAAASEPAPAPASTSER